MLDAGCGSGRDLAWLRARGFDAEGIDFSPALVRLAGQATGASVREADLRLLSIARDTYDGIWANRSLVHLNAVECQRALAAFFKALKARGRLFVSIDVGQTDEIGAITDDRRDDPQGPARQFHAYPANEFASLIRQHGFNLLVEGRSLSDDRRIGWIAERVA